MNSMHVLPSVPFLYQELRKALNRHWRPRKPLFGWRMCGHSNHGVSDCITPPKSSQSLLPGSQVRIILDSYGGQAVKVVPCTPALLHAPVSKALVAPEPNWNQPAPQAWLSGSTWGSQRTILFSGLKYGPPQQHLSWTLQKILFQ